MKRTDYAYQPLAESQYEAIVTAGTMQGVSPIAGATNFASFDAACKARNVDPRVLLSALLWEDHFGTDSDGGVTLAKVFNFGGIKFVSPAPDGWYDSGIPYPANEGTGTYAGFHDFGSFILALCDTLNNEYCGPSFREGDLVGAWAIYVGGPNNPNHDAGQKRVDQWEWYLRHFAPVGGTMVSTPIYGEDVARAALKHLGQTHEYDPLNGDHPVYYMCEADVEDWCAEAGVPQPAMPDANTNADRAPLSTTFPAPIGALLFFKGPGWSQYGHLGVSYSDEGGTISGLNSVVVSSGWQSTAVGCVGWRFPDGVTAAHPSGPVIDPNLFYAPGNPYGAIAMKTPFWNRWHKLDGEGLAFPQLGFPVKAEVTLPSSRRVQQFERGWLGTQDAPDPWDVVTLMPSEAHG